MSKRKRRTPDLYRTITDQIVEDLARGDAPWHKPWKSGRAVSRPVRHNRAPYQGINILILWSAALVRGFASNQWMTYRQAKQLGGQVRRGEHATYVFLAKTYTREEADDDGTAVDVTRAVRRAYAVFNCDQIDDLPEQYVAEIPDVNPETRDAACETWFANLGADVSHGGTRAFYRLEADLIRMPPFQTFDSAESYYATLAHESVHWTGSPKRLDRDSIREPGDRARAREELVAELGSAFLCADLGLRSTPRSDHAPYIASWLKLLADEPRAIFGAATRAQVAVEYLHGLQPAGGA